MKKAGKLDFYHVAMNCHQVMEILITIQEGLGLP